MLNLYLVTPYTCLNLYLIGTSQSSTHYRYPVLHEVHWGADFQSVITRKLINETHGNVKIMIMHYSGFVGREVVCNV